MIERMKRLMEGGRIWAKKSRPVGRRDENTLSIYLRRRYSKAAAPRIPRAIVEGSGMATMLKPWRPIKSVGTDGGEPALPKVRLSRIDSPLVPWAAASQVAP